MAGQRRLANRTFYISISSAYIYRKRLRFRVACLIDTPRNMIFLFFCFGMLIEKNLLIRVPGQRRLAISRSRVPNLDGFVIAAAGNLFSIGTPHHRVDPEIVRSQDTNQQKQRGENLREKELGKKNVPARVPGHRALAKVHDEIMYIFIFFEHLFLKKSHFFEWPVSQTLRQKHDCVVNFLTY